MTTSPFTITPTPPTSIKLEPGKEGKFSFTVTSLAAPDTVLEVLLQARLIGADGKDKSVDWLFAGPQETIKMTCGKTETVTITARPTAASPLGENSIKLVVADKGRPNDVFTDSPPVTCEVVAPPVKPTAGGGMPKWLLPVIIAGAVVVVGGGILIFKLMSRPSAPAKACVEGQRQPCYSGPAATAGVGACHAGERTCTAGAWGACTGEVVPHAEACNGLDDDCSGVADQGCPADGDIKLGNGVTSPLFGSAITFNGSNTLFEQRCPTGEVVVGFHGHGGESIDALGLYCGTPTVSIQSKASTPYQYAVTIPDDGQPISAAGGSGGGEFQSRCPADQAVVAVRVWTATNQNGGSVYGLQFKCSGYGVGGSIGAFDLRRIGTPTEGARIAGGNAGLPPSPTDFACQGQQVLTGVNGNFGPWPVFQGYTVVNGMQFACQAPSIRLRDGSS